jgi:Uncharacterized conserved protein
MLEFRDIELADKERFESYTHGHRNTEASFANIFLWRKVCRTKIAMDGQAMYLLLDIPNYRRFMLAPFLLDYDASYKEPLQRICEYMSAHCGGFFMKGVIGCVRERIEADCPGNFSLVPDRANFEYVYLSSDLRTLEGKNPRKRNHINRLLQEHEVEYRAYRPEDYDACIALHKQWMEDKGGETKGYTEEFTVTQAALTNMERLNLKCGMLYVDGKLTAFSIGEGFKDDMAVIHIEKADPEVQGAYAMINREFARAEWSEVKYINREEDMDIEGLRKAKLSYNPVFLIEKYTCVRSEA